MNEQSSRQQLELKAWARPKRVAFVVPEESIADADLNKLMLLCMECWGGSNFSIVPTHSGGISASYRGYLRQADPDVVCLLMSAPDVLLNSIDALVEPFQIVVQPDITQLESVFNDELRPLKLDDILHVFSFPAPYNPSARLFKIEDVAQSDESTDFIVRNFGALRSEVFEPVFEQLQRQFTCIEKGVESPHDLLPNLTASAVNSGLVFPILLGSPRIHMRGSQRSTLPGFQVIVGDSVHDVLYAWNRRIQIRWPFELDTLWLSTNLASNEAMLTKVAAWVRTTYSPLHQNRCKVISHSCTQEQLKKIASKLSSESSFSFDTQLLSPGTFLRDGDPPIPACTQARQEFFNISTRGSTFNAPAPPTLVLDKSVKGSWMVDLEIQALSDTSTRHFRKSVWHLPLRHHLSSRFIETRNARVDCNGHLSVEVMQSARHLNLKLPKISDLFSNLFERREYRGGKFVRCNNAPQIVSWDISDKGFYLEGILGFFEQMQQPELYFNSPFWIDVFQRLGAAPKDYADRFAEGIERLVQEGDSESKEKIETLSRRFNSMLKVDENVPKGLTAHELSSMVGKPKYKECAFRDVVLNIELPSLLRRGILFHGTNLTCNACLTTEWYAIDGLAAEILCAGCREYFPLKHNFDWSCTLNQLVSNGIKKHGLLPVLQTLSYICAAAAESVFIIPSCNVYTTTEENRQAFTDLDLVCVVDGKFIFVEVKSSARGLENEEELEKLAHVASELRADYIAFAAPKDAFTPIAEEKIERIRVKLSGAPIKVVCIKLTTGETQEIPNFD